MLVHGISAVDAFAVLRWHSQRANIKLRVLAGLIVEGISRPGVDETPNQLISRILGGVVSGYADQWRSPIGGRGLGIAPAEVVVEVQVGK